MLNENAYREVVNNAQRLIDGTECIPQGKTLEFILRKRYVETIKADRKSDLSLSKMRGLLKGNRAVVRGDCETTNEKTFKLFLILLQTKIDYIRRNSKSAALARIL